MDVPTKKIQYFKDLHAWQEGHGLIKKSKAIIHNS